MVEESPQDTLGTIVLVAPHVEAPVEQTESVPGLPRAEES